MYVHILAEGALQLLQALACINRKVYQSNKSRGSKPRFFILIRLCTLFFL